jgi:hypothetical protein
MFEKYPIASIPEIKLPLGVEVVTHLHEDNYYLILQGNTHIFQFAIPSGGYVEFKFAHSTPHAQDYSLHGHFSQFPLGASINTTDISIQYFAFPRIQRTIILKDKLFAIPRKDNQNYLYPSGIYYLNIQNLLAWQNGYYLSLKMHDHLLPHNYPIAGSSAPATPPLSFP